MNLQEYIDSKLANYSDAFDLYMDGEKIPDSLSTGICWVTYSLKRYWMPILN